MNPRLPKMIGIVGPTASGKSDLGLYVAKKYRGEILCADSRTIYQGLDIGAAKPTAADRKAVPHHLLDLVRPDQTLTVAQFKAMADAVCAEVLARGHVPVVVGGSGLYVDALLYGFGFAPPADPAVLAQLNALPLNELVARLERLDPEAVRTIDLRNPRRVVRAIVTAGAPPRQRRPLQPGTLLIGIAPDKQVIQQRISDRIDAMLTQGFAAEVERLAARYGWDNEAMSGIGYRAFRGVIEGKATVADATAAFKRGDRRLVKKQLTWFRRNPDINWITGSAVDLEARADELIAAFMATAWAAPGSR